MRVRKTSGAACVVQKVGPNRPARDPPAEGSGGRVLFLLRRAAREGRRTRPPSGGLLETGVELDLQPATTTREGLVSVRPLLENSTACRKSVPSNTPCRVPSGLGWDSFG